MFILKNQSTSLLFNLFRRYHNLKHPFERELAGIETFEQWEYRRASHAWSVFLPYASLESLFSQKTIVDIGCGGGGKTLALLAYCPKQVVGIDLDAAFIEKAKHFQQQFSGNASFILANAEKMPFKDASVDRVTLLDTFEHLSDPIKILKECHRILRPSGLVLISFPPYYHPQGAHVSDLIPIPWVHLFFSEQALCQAYLALSTTRKDGFNRRKLKCSYSNHQWELGYINHMTIRKAECILKQVDFQLKYLKLIPLRKMMTPLVKHKLLREFFTHSVAIVLKKGEKEDES